MKTKHRSMLLAGASTIALAPAALFAQEAIELDAIVVTATTDVTTQADGYKADYNQSATKSDTPVAETTQSVSVVTAEQIRDQGAETLGQALRYSPGVLGDPYGVDPRFDSPTIRGFEARGSQYVNGLRQLRYMGAPAYETFALQQIEVLNGPNSSLYGAGSPAGIINQVQKRAQGFDFGELGVGLDDNGSRQSFFDWNRTVSDTLSFRATGIAKDYESQVEEIGLERGYLGLAARWKPTDRTTLDIISSYTDDAPTSPPGIPFALTGQGNDKYLRELYTGEPGWDDHDRQIFNIGYELSHEFDSGWTFSQGFRYEKFDWEYTGHYVTGIDASGTGITRGANYQRENTTGLSLDSRLAGEVLTGGMEHKLLFGLDLRKYDADTVTEFYNADGGVTNLDWRNPIYGGVPTGAPWYVSKPDVTQTQIGLYAQDEITAGRWRGSIALRHDWSKQEGTTYTNFAGEGEIDQSDKALSGRAGLGYEIAPGALVYANYSTSFDPEIGVDGAGEQLEPTTGKQWELGVKYQPDSFNALFTAAIYDLRQENLTVNLGGAEGRRQVGEVKSSGLELGAVGELAPGLNLRASYAYNDTEQVDPSGANDGNEMPNAPRHLASLWLDKAFDNGVSLGGGLRYIGEREGDLANLYSLDSVTLLDLAVGYSRENMDASINLNNLSDEVYLANCGSFGCYYGEGRTISAKISYKW
ncbi:TonB-dependent siderophore receptor [Cereibacter sphaeroides WS8N]|uniref:TonB-dependent receptor n=1 Tax=Cereibacter sphaeroides TaxID=1063 RepID=UPI00020DF37C|nr:TonB-dependent siderophore receptor [Cereibacter sphaeroides]EGJ22931.1 TonB-dependent siderophore receptor [Cereibacter sphaeroides WS8N]